MDESNVRKIRLTGSGTVEVQGDNLVVSPANDGGFSVVVQGGGEITLYVYHPLSGWYVQAGPGILDGEGVSRGDGN